MCEYINATTQPSLKNLTDPAFASLEKQVPQALKNIFKPHVESFNWFLTEGLKSVPKALEPLEVQYKNYILEVKCIDVHVEKPKVVGFRSSTDIAFYPSECRQRGTSYLTRIYAKFATSINGVQKGIVARCVGSIPMMVKSVGCNLHGMKPKQLVKHFEEENEMGGYFIINGKEKVVRMIEMLRRNFPILMMRQGFKKRGEYFTEYGVFVRSVAKTGLTKLLWLHYLNNGMFCLCVKLNKATYVLPLMLVIKAFANMLDVEIYREMVQTKEDDYYFKTCIQNMLRQLLPYKLETCQSVFAYIGKIFAHRLGTPEWYSDEKNGEYFLKNNILVHLNTYEEKFRFLCIMTRKVYDFALKKCFLDGLDSLQITEVMVPGHLYQVFLIERLNMWCRQLKKVIQKKLVIDPAVQVNAAYIQACMSMVSDITRGFVSLMATGNMGSRDGLGIPQNNGLVVQGDKLNYIRFVSHFRAVHKGARFKTMRDTKCRRLTSDSWGFLCPVHTPDGAPCGLLNHLAHLCDIVTHQPPSKPILSFLYDHGMLSPGSSEVKGKNNFYVALLDGNFIGWIPVNQARDIANMLRFEKVQKDSKIPEVLEICLIEYLNKPTQYPGFYLFTDAARMIRPVVQLATGHIEMIGTFEQMYMDICVLPEEAHELTTHQEVSQQSILSTVASLTPFSDHNQSPRNMYQCQMAKQTMGTSSLVIPFRGDQKVYRLMTPQSPIVRPYMYDICGMDHYSFGTNAIVAVISYTGYDMEDAMILNKSSVELGFCNSVMYKTEIIDLAEEEDRSSGHLTFGYNPNDDYGKPPYTLDGDGLPSIGQYLEQGSQYYSFINHTTKRMVVKKYISSEAAYVDNIKILGNDSGTSDFTRVSITLRIPRNPMIGDKFASRHGQKGVCSRLWPMESLPFTESGMYPDIIFNPHGFPSRMTIGMMIESLAGKAAAVNGECYDATPFTFSEEHPAIEYFGEMLRKAGFNYYGTEKMYSGVSGVELEAEIFFGVVHYQRLRHMVSDKYQVRTTGPVDTLTQQPLKGRRRGGGVRFGEMERDALLSHGAAMLLHDRLMVNSDLTQAYVCEKCESILSPISEYRRDTKKQFWHCKLCKSSEHLAIIDIPYVFYYLVNELAAMNVKLSIKLE